MKKPRKATDKGFTERMTRWRHYSFSGSAKMMEAQMRNMLASTTITDDTRLHVQALLPEITKLQHMLKQRKQ